jgi:hypothetical protein
MSNAVSTVATQPTITPRSAEVRAAAAAHTTQIEPTRSAVGDRRVAAHPLSRTPHPIANLSLVFVADNTTTMHPTGASRVERINPMRLLALYLWRPGATITAGAGGGSS